MYSRLLNPSGNKSFFLLGPRGTGKTSWIARNYPQAIYLDLLRTDLYNDFLARPGRLESYIPAKHHDWIVIDEVQRVPELLNEVHRLIENRGCKFVLTGSSARKLRKKGVNLLAGRALTHHFHPLTTKELGNDFDCEHSLKFGQLPCAYTEDEPQAYLESYVSTYLREEVQQEGLTRNLAIFSRFMEAASFSQAAVLNISDVARDCAAERKLVENYFMILEDLLLAVRLQPFTKRAKRRLTQHPKFFYFDAGVYRTLRPQGPLDRPEEIDGAALETLFLQEVRALNEYNRWGYEIYYWHSSNGREVDFVLYGKRGIHAFEIKRSRRLDDKMFSGLRSFMQDYPMAKPYLLSFHSDERRIDGVTVLHFARALKRLGTIL